MQSEVAALRSVMIENVETLLERGNKLGVLVDKSDRYTQLLRHVKYTLLYFFIYLFTIVKLTSLLLTLHT